MPCARYASNRSTAFATIDYDVFYNELNLALDRTALTQTAAIAFSKPITKHLQINADVLVTDISGTPESGGVLATPGSGPDYFVSTQFIGSSVLKDGDIGIVGLRYQNMTTSERYFLDLNGRYPITRRFRINPRFRLGYRQDKDVDFTQVSYKPSIRLDYYPWGNLPWNWRSGPSGSRIRCQPATRSPATSS